MANKLENHKNYIARILGVQLQNLEEMGGVGGYPEYIDIMVKVKNHASECLKVATKIYLEEEKPGWDELAELAEYLGCAIKLDEEFYSREEVIDIIYNLLGEEE